MAFRANSRSWSRHGASQHGRQPPLSSARRTRRCVPACRRFRPASGSGGTSLEYAAEKGVPGAMWKLGRMYADGEALVRTSCGRTSTS